MVGMVNLLNRDAVTGRLKSLVDHAVSERILCMGRQGIKAKVIAKQEGVSAGFVYKVLLTEKLAVRKPSAKFELEMERLYREGFSMQAIADKFGLKHATVWRHLNSLGVARPRSCGMHKQRGVPKASRRSITRDGLKLCTICKEWKLPEVFPYGSTSLDGKRPLCKECQNIKHNAKRSRASYATPLWVDRVAVDVIYAIAQQRTKIEGIQYEVDHVVPLNGRLVSGLHVPWNLRVVTKAENRAKRNNHAVG